MGQLAFFIMALIAPCLISAYGGDGSPKAIVQKISGLEKFVPPQQGCVATIVSDLYCPWCTEMHLQMKRIMAKNYVPTIDYRGTTAIMTQSKDPNFRMRHMKVTCFVNYLITDNFKGLGHVFNPQLLRYLKGKEWFVFIKGERKKEFLKCWANEIDANFGRVFPRIALVMRNPDENEGNALHPLARAFENLAKGEFSMAFSCYLCGEGHYFVYDESTSSNPWNLMQRTKEVTGNNAPIGESPENQYFNSWRPYPAEMVNLEAIMMFAIQQHVNYSFVQGEKSIGIYFHTAQAVGENEEVVEAFRSGFIPFKSVFIIQRCIQPWILPITAYQQVFHRSCFTIRRRILGSTNRVFGFVLSRFRTSCLVRLQCDLAVLGSPTTRKTDRSLANIGCNCLDPNSILIQRVFRQQCNDPV